MIKLGNLGEFAQAMGACKLIREYHRNAHITLLTTEPYKDLAKTSPYFDDIWLDTNQESLSATWALARSIKKTKFSRVYDLQNSARSHKIFSSLRPFRPEWSGTSRGCSHPHKNRKRLKMHVVDRLGEQLAMAGVGLGRGRVGGRADPPDLSWVEDEQRGAARTELTWFGVRKPFALLAPGSNAKNRGKHWPAENFGKLAMRLRRAGIMPVILGTDLEKQDAFVIQQVCPGALSLINRTDHIQIIMLARQAAMAIGNDTGPMHLIASADCPTVVLYTEDAQPEIRAPRGEDVTVVQKDDLNELSVGELWDILILSEALEPLLASLQ